MHSRKSSPHASLSELFNWCANHSSPRRFQHVKLVTVPSWLPLKQCHREKLAQIVGAFETASAILGEHVEQRDLS